MKRTYSGLVGADSRRLFPFLEKLRRAWASVRSSMGIAAQDATPSLLLGGRVPARIAPRSTGSSCRKAVRFLSRSRILRWPWRVLIGCPEGISPFHLLSLQTVRFVYHGLSRN